MIIIVKRYPIFPQSNQMHTSLEPNKSLNFDFIDQTGKSSNFDKKFRAQFIHECKNLKNPRKKYFDLDLFLAAPHLLTVWH